MPDTHLAAVAGSDRSTSSRYLGLDLLVIATAQLMMVLDDTVANVALPSIQVDLNMSGSALPWVINAYVLTFGGFARRCPTSAGVVEGDFEFSITYDATETGDDGA